MAAAPVPHPAMLPVHAGLHAAAAAILHLSGA